MDEDDKKDADRVKCRPCCTAPGGVTSLLAGLFSTIALAFSYTAINTCRYIYSEIEYCAPPLEPPEPHYACCGDCYCITDVVNGEASQCPDQVPMMNFSDAMLQEFMSLELTNPMNLTCNPYDTQYTGIPCDTSPPQTLTELGDEAVCGALYDRSTLTDDQCPTRYSLETYPDVATLQAAGAVLTHWGSCGVCSTTQDLAVYMEYTDLTDLGSQCSIAGILDFELGVRCYQRAGYTRACSEMWMYNGLNTKDSCGKTCTLFRAEGRPNNGPPSKCTLDECLQCDEDESGPLFTKVAARSRRRSGLISKIARPCDDILFVDHQNPCDVVQGITRQNEQGDVCKEIDPGYDPTPRCSEFDGGLGLFSHTTVTTSTGLFNFDIKLIKNPDDAVYETYYGTCSRYNTRQAISGYWDYMAQEYLGTPWKAAKIFGLIAVIFGTILVICIWSAAGCIACKPAFWHAMGGFTLLVGILDFLTLVFLLSSVCTTQGCVFGVGAVMAILAGIFWFIAASLCFRTAVVDMAAHNLVLQSRVEITEYIEPDGVTITETTTIQSSGTTTIQRTVRRPTVTQESSDKEVISSSHVIAGGSISSNTDSEPIVTPNKDKGE